LRIEDVALGCAVSVVVGVLFWPRGVLAGLGAALDEAYAAAGDRLRRVVLVLTGETRQVPDAVEHRLEAARRSLDDAFRLFLAERGTERVPLHDATELAATATRLRLVGASLADLARDGMACGEPRGLPEIRLREAVAGLDLWLRELGDALAGRRPDVPAPERADEPWGEALVDDLPDGAADGTDGRVRGRTLMVLWTAQHLDAARRREEQLSASSAAVVKARSRRAWI
ncbi:MAG TPA: hypothetical protein VEV65_11260, partial [Kineosporiaceae bacterium]|nr:hypothetical protein [Kineosporiaceae bacterium]